MPITFHCLPVGEVIHCSIMGPFPPIELSWIAQLSLLTFRYGPPSVLAAPRDVVLPSNQFSGV